MLVIIRREVKRRPRPTIGDTVQIKSSRFSSCVQKTLNLSSMRIQRKGPEEMTERILDFELWNIKKNILKLECFRTRESCQRSIHVCYRSGKRQVIFLPRQPICANLVKAQISSKPTLVCVVYLLNNN